MLITINVSCIYFKSNTQKSSMSRSNGEIPDERAHTRISIKSSQQSDSCMVDGLVSLAILNTLFRVYIEYLIGTI